MVFANSLSSRCLKHIAMKKKMYVEILYWFYPKLQNCWLQVERAAEACAAAMAGVLPFDAVIRVLNPIVKTGEYPVNQAAVKMLTKVAEHKDSKDVIISHLADIMPGLLRVSEAKPYCIYTQGQKSSSYPKVHILKTSFLTKFTFPKPHCWQNSHFESIIFHKIHIFRPSFLT